MIFFVVEVVLLSLSQVLMYGAENSSFVLSIPDCTLMAYIPYILRLLLLHRKHNCKYWRC